MIKKLIYFLDLHIRLFKYLDWLEQQRINAMSQSGRGWV